MRRDLLDSLKTTTVGQLYSGFYTDPLTRCLNRRAFEQTQYDHLYLIDLDSLKYINDTIGHRAGDILLTTLADVLVKAFGPDAVFRIAGDEFVVTNTFNKKSVVISQTLCKIRASVNIFSFGFGNNIDDADKLLRVDKEAREILARRAKRGEQPPWYNEIQKAWFKAPKLVVDNAR